MLGSVQEHGSGDVAGSGKGSGSTPERITQGHGVAMNMQSPSRVENVVHAAMAVPDVGRGGPCERFYIGDGPTSHETTKGSRAIGMF